MRAHMHTHMRTRCPQALYARVHKCVTGNELPETSAYAYSRAPTFEADVDQD